MQQLFNQPPYLGSVSFAGTYSQRRVNFIEILNGLKELESGEMDLLQSAISHVVVRDDSVCVNMNVQIQQVRGRGVAGGFLILVRNKLEYHFHNTQATWLARSLSKHNKKISCMKNNP